MKMARAKATWVAACVALGAVGGAVSLSTALADGDRKTESVIGTNLIIPYKGYLMQDSDGLSGDQRIRFELFDVATGGNAVWASERDVTAINGSFSIALGQNVSLNDDVLDAERLWLSMTILEMTGGAITAEVALSGRQAIEVTPYAVWSKNASDHAVAGALTVGGDVTVGQNVSVASLTANSGLDADSLDSTDGRFTAPDIVTTTGSLGSLSVSNDIDSRSDLVANGSTISLGNGSADTVTVTGTLAPSGNIQTANNKDITGMSAVAASNGSIYYYATNSSTDYAMLTGGTGWMYVGVPTTITGEFSDGTGGVYEIDTSLSIGGTATITGKLDVTGTLERDNNDCPSGEIGSVENEGARLCVYSVTGSYDWYAGAYQCFHQHGADLCSMAEFRRALAQNIPTNANTDYWLKDRVNWDDAVIVNNATNNEDFDGTADADNDKSGAYCCRIISDM